MSNLFNFISNAANKFKDRNSNNLIEALQLNQNGEVDPEKTLELKQHTTPRTLSEHLLGRNMSFDTQKINPATGETQLETISNFQPGFLNNLNAGANENFKNNFEVDNLKPNNKGFGYKIGEALGTFGRGLSGWAGDAYIAGTQGLDAAMNRQNIRTADNLYRKSLENQGIDTAGITGFIGDRAYQNYMLSNYRNRSLDVRQQLGLLGNNTQRARMISTMLSNGTMSPEQAAQQMAVYGIDTGELGLSNQTVNRMINEELLPYKKYALQTAPEVALGNLGLNYARFNETQSQNDFNNAMKVAEFEEKKRGGANDFTDIEKQLNNFQATFQNMPSKAESYTAGALRNLTGMQTPNEANFLAQRTLLFNQIARKLGGEKGVLSDFDIKRIEAALPNLTDSYEQKMAKMKAVYDLLDIKKGNTQNVNNDPLGIR